MAWNDLPAPALLLYFLVLALGNAFAVCFFQSRFLEPRFHRLFPLLVFTALGVGLSAVYGLVSPAARNFLSGALTVAAVFPAYRGSAARRLTVACAAQVAVLASELAVIGLAGALGITLDSLTDDVPFNLVMNCVVINACMVPLAFACGPLLRSRVALAGRGEPGVPLASAAVLASGALLGSFVALALSYSEALAWALGALGLVLIVLSLLLFDRIFRQWLAARQAEEKETLLRREYALARRDREGLLRYRKEIASLKAGMDGVLSGAEELLERGDAAAALESLRRNLERVRSVRRPKRYRNPVADYFLAELESRCRAGGIALSEEVSLPAEAGVDDADLCTVLSNMLDNAVGACAALPADRRRYIRLTLHRNGGVLFLGCRNPKPEGGGKKEESRRHYGLANIRETAEKYGGNVEIADRRGEFSIRVLMYCKS